MTTDTQPEEDARRSPAWHLPSCGRASTWGFPALALLIASATGVLGELYFQRNQALEHRDTQKALQVAADLKARQLSQWHRERMGDGRSFLGTPMIVRTIRDFIVSPSATNREALLGFMRTVDDVYDYESVALFDASGRCLLASPEDPSQADTTLPEAVTGAARSREVQMADVHLGKPGGAPFMSVLVPIGNPDDVEQPPSAVLVLQIDPAHYLFREVESRSDTSQTGETFLVRREGSDVLVLTALRNLPAAFPSVRTKFGEDPLLPAAMAVLGREGPVTGVDYRGVPVLAALRAVPGTPWFLVAKVDQAEIDGPLAAHALTITILCGGLILALLFSLRLLWVRQRLSSAQRELTLLRERQALDQTLRVSEDRYSRAVRGTNDGLWDWDRVGHDGYFSPRFLELLGLERPPEMRDTTFLQLVHPDDKARIQAGLEAHLKGHASLDMEIRLRCPIEFRWFLVRGEAVRDDAGNPVRLAGSISDVTERKAAEHALRKVSMAVEQSPLSIIITDTGGTIEYVNPHFTRLTGYSADEVLGRNPRLLKSGAQGPELYQQLWTTLSSGAVWEGELRNRKKSGELYWEMAKIAPLRNEAGVVTSYVAVKEDITERKQREAEREGMLEQLVQARKMESVGRLAGGVAHDFNNMLAAILGYTDLTLAELEPGTEAHDNLVQVRAAAQRSADLTRQLLAFARKQTISPQVMDLNDAIGHMLKLLRRLMGEDIELVWKPGADLWSIHVDPSQIDQVLANLTVNARDAIQGVGTLSISTVNVTLDDAGARAFAGARAGEYVRLDVRDTGSGMDPHTLEHLFEPFFTTKELGRGTGLGTATVYGIVQQNGGFVDVQSAVGRGTTFSVHFPRAQGIHHPESPEVPRPPGGKETILLVEDERAVLELGRVMLTRLGYSVLCARTGTEAMEHARQHAGDIHLLVTDVVMPGMNGDDLQLALRALRPSTRILFVSGYTADIIAHNGVLDGAAQFLPKPFSVQDLAAKVRQTLDA